MVDVLLVVEMACVGSIVVVGIWRDVAWRR
jgi:hypothetical protein